MKNNYSVLFIDDSKIDNSYIKTMLEIEELPIDAQFSPNAIHALDLLATLTSDQFPQILIIDINMPLMNGFEFVEAYQEKFYADYPDTLLYISSSTYRLSEIEKAKNLSAVKDYVGKPIESKFFRETVFPLVDKVPS